MGVTGLWQHLKPAAVDKTFEQLAFDVFDEAYVDWREHGQGVNANRLLGLRVGIDASAWFFHSYESEGGANPELRNLFHRIVRLSKAGALALFVFDGPHRPPVKRGSRIWRGEHRLEADTAKLIEAFGYEWRLAPGEAEAELAMLSRRNEIDLIITDDADSFLFGAQSVLKNAFSVSSERPPTLYRHFDIEAATDLTIPGLILVALMSGGDYDQSGLSGIGPTIAIALAKGGYGERLAHAVKTLSGKQLQSFFSGFRDDIRHQLTTNEAGLLARKAAVVAKKIPDNWPDAKTARRYYDPDTSEVPKYASFSKRHTWAGRIDIGKLTEVMDELFEFTHQEILQKFRNQIWECVVVHHLIRALHRPSGSAAATVGDSAAESPSKQLARALDDFALASPSRSGPSSPSAHPAPNMSPSALAVFQQVTKLRQYKPGKKITQELQLLIDPSLLAQQAMLRLRHPDPNVGKLQARKVAAAALIARQLGSDAPGAVPAADRNSVFEDPDKEYKLWIQESLLRLAYPQLVEEWEQREEEKAEAKRTKAKGKGRSPRGKAGAAKKAVVKGPAKPKRHETTSEEEDSDSELRSKSTAASKSAPPKKKAEEDVFGSSPPALPAPSKYAQLRYDYFGNVARVKTAASAALKPGKAKSRSNGPLPPTPPSEDSDSDVQILDGPPRPKPRAQPPSKSVSPALLSPTKSPRRSLSADTARRSSSSLPSPPVSNKSASASAIPAEQKAAGAARKARPANVQAKAPFLYRDDVSDSGSESDLPGLPAFSLMGASVGMGRKGTGSSSGSSSTVSKTQTKRESHTSVAPSTGKNTVSTSKQPSKGKASIKAPPTIIDLCSSD